MPLDSFYNKALKIWKDISPEEAKEAIDLEIEAHKKILTLFQAGTTYYFIFNVNRGGFEFISNEIRAVLGYEPSELTAFDFLSNIHPDDQAYFIAFEEQLLHFFRELSIEQIPRYKIQYDFRVKNSMGEYRQILHQMIIIQFDDDKNLLRSMGVHSDITHIKFGSVPKLSFIGSDGEPSYFNITGNTITQPAKKLFTRREKEILRLIVAGNTSSQIAEMLVISLHTVNSHRKKIINKSGATSLADLLSKTVANGWV